MMKDIERRILRLEERAPPSDPQAADARWNEFTAIVLAFPGGVLPAHLHDPEWRDEAIEELFAEFGISDNGDAFQVVCQFLDKLAVKRAAGAWSGAG